MNKHLISAALLALALMPACASTDHAAEAADDGVAVAEKAMALAPRSGDANSSKRGVDPSTGVAYSAMGAATAIAAPQKAYKDAQNTSTGHVQTGFMVGGATDSQMSFVNGLIEKDVALQSIGAQIETLLAAWNLEGGQTPANADMLVALRKEYEARFDKISALGSAAMPSKVDLTKLTTLGVFNWSSGYSIGTDPGPMTEGEATAAQSAAIAMWQGITATATQNEDAVIDGGLSDEQPAEDAGDSEGGTDGQ